MRTKIAREVRTTSDLLGHFLEYNLRTNAAQINAEKMSNGVVKRRIKMSSESNWPRQVFVTLLRNSIKLKLKMASHEVERELCPRRRAHLKIVQYDLN